VRDEHTAQDLTQDTFVKVIKGLKSWDGRSALSTWITRVTMNVCLTHLRSAKVRAHSSLNAPFASSLTRAGHSERSSENSGISQIADRELLSDSRVQQRERSGAIAKALSSLEPEVRSILVLRDVQDLDYEQIAQALDIPVGTVKSRLFRARLALRQEVEKLGISPTIGSG
jgi:RNA polymerase sigma-70 factor, ECF subfamily